MPPKKRDPNDDTVKKPKAKRQKKKKAEFDDSESESDVDEQNNGSGETVEDSGPAIDIVNHLPCLQFSEIRIFSNYSIWWTFWSLFLCL